MEKTLSRILVTILDISYLKKAEKEIRLFNQLLERKVIQNAQKILKG